jgi:signal transduction histidine kinase/CheY-like chemotaxis protein
MESNQPVIIGSFVLLITSIIMLIATVVMSDRLYSTTAESLQKAHITHDPVMHNYEYQFHTLFNELSKHSLGNSSQDEMTMRYSLFVKSANLILDTIALQEQFGIEENVSRAGQELHNLISYIEQKSEPWTPSFATEVLQYSKTEQTQFWKSIDAQYSLDGVPIDSFFQSIVADRQDQIEYIFSASAICILLLICLLLYLLTKSSRYGKDQKKIFDIADAAVVQLKNELNLRIKAEQTSDELRIAAKKSRDCIVFANQEGRILFSNAESACNGQFKCIENVRFEKALHNRLTISEVLVLPIPDEDGISIFGYNTAGNHRLWIQWSISRFETSEGEKRYLAIGRDVTSERETNEHIARIQRVETLGILAGGMAHDFNNVLATVVGSAHLARDEAAEIDNNEIIEELDQVLIAAKRASELVDGLLLLGRNDANDKDYSEWGRVLENVSQLTKVNKSTSVNLVFGTNDLNAWIGMRASNLHQILFNLIKNAKDSIGSSTGEISILLKIIDSTAEITVSDNGPGIPKDIQELIFEPFYSTKTTGKGSGLGLALIKSLTTDAQGTISVESSLGSGTKFIIRLPLYQADIDSNVDKVKFNKKAQQVALCEKDEKPCFHVLIVDDESEVLRITKLIIEKAGYKVTAFLDPFDANEFFISHQQEIDVIVSDVLMPGMTGPALIDEIRSHDPTIGVIFVSAYTNVDIGLDDNTRFLQKPADPKKLFDNIQTLCESRIGHIPV